VVFASCNNKSSTEKVWKVSLCGLEFEYSRHNRSKWNVLCSGKSRKGFTLACSRLTLGEWWIAFVKVCTQWTCALPLYILASGWLIVWVRPCNAWNNCNGMKRARRNTGTEWHMSASFVSWLWFNGWKHNQDALRHLLGVWSIKQNKLYVKFCSLDNVYLYKISYIPLLQILHILLP